MRYLIILVFATVSCASDEEKPFKGFSKPEHFPDATYTFDNNPLTPEGIELGRKLFYDTRLSRDGTISCASCHLQAVAFADPVHKISVGVDGRIGTRNAPPIFNLAFSNTFFWDGGVTHVDFIPINAITNPNELDETLDHVLQKLQADQHYPDDFNNAFGRGEITTQKMLHALAQFTVIMISATSRYDQYVLGDKSALSTEEVKGLRLFETNCSTCHQPPLFTNGQFSNNGLDDSFRDPGRAIITESPDDIGKFRVPTLRNIELTDPFMHDGRFRTLEHVLSHYQHHVKYSSTLDPILQNGEAPGIIITDQEKANIIAFLKTLTDQKFIRDKRFANPFVK